MVDGQNTELLFWKTQREESRLLLWCGISCLSTFFFVASIGTYQSVNSCLVAAIVFVACSSKICHNFLLFFLVHDFSWSWILSSPTFQVTGGFLCAPKLFCAFWFLPPFWMCFIKHNCLTTFQGSFVKHSFRRVLLNVPAVWTASLIKSVHQNKFLTCLSFGVNGVLDESHCFSKLETKKQF